MNLNLRFSRSFLMKTAVMQPAPYSYTHSDLKSGTGITTFPPTTQKCSRLRAEKEKSIMALLSIGDHVSDLKGTHDGRLVDIDGSTGYVEQAMA